MKLAQEAMVLVLLLSLPPIVAASLVGTLVSLIQALTQIQEQTLGFVLKLVAVIISLIATGHWMAAELVQLGRTVFTSI
ncbi:type III secretion system export apparatus subunit SctS [Marinibactrum halimedae]|nr:type III secretion system export apparatus subunit SctS [Marinibactrum halimedae]MCD9459075.1 type III secretion system export apparatus subunit SctS [Marinibactrum halimedae]